MTDKNTLDPSLGRLLNLLYDKWTPDPVVFSPISNLKLGDNSIEFSSEVVPFVNNYSLTFEWREKDISMSDFAKSLENDQNKYETLEAESSGQIIKSTGARRRESASFGAVSYKDISIDCFDWTLTNGTDCKYWLINLGKQPNLGIGNLSLKTEYNDAAREHYGKRETMGNFHLRSGISDREFSLIRNKTGQTWIVISNGDQLVSDELNDELLILDFSLGLNITTSMLFGLDQDLQTVAAKSISNRIAFDKYRLRYKPCAESETGAYFLFTNATKYAKDHPVDWDVLRSAIQYYVLGNSNEEQRSIIVNLLIGIAYAAGLNGSQRAVTGDAEIIESTLNSKLKKNNKKVVAALSYYSDLFSFRPKKNDISSEHDDWRSAFLFRSFLGALICRELKYFGNLYGELPDGSVVKYDEWYDAPKGFKHKQPTKFVAELLVDSPIGFTSWPQFQAPNVPDSDLLAPFYDSSKKLIAKTNGSVGARLRPRPSVDVNRRIVDFNLYLNRFPREQVTLFSLMFKEDQLEIFGANDFENCIFSQSESEVFLNSFVQSADMKIAVEELLLLEKELREIQ